jgi:hypothetical protein
MPAYNADLDFQKAVSLQQSGRLADAAVAYRKLLAAFPDNPKLLNNLGTVLLQLGNIPESIALLERALKVFPDQPLALLNLGIGLLQLNRLDDALASLDRALALKPDLAAAHYRRGSVLQELGLHAEALASADAALALKPGHLDAQLSRGGMLMSLNRFDEALASFERAIALRPDCVNAHIFRGEILKDLKRFDEALESYDRAIALQPDSADAHWSKSNLLLLMGDYAQGWLLHEWRWKSPYFSKHRRDFEQPPWLGESSPAGKTLLIHAEGGFGDVIQKCRYIPAAQALGADVILEMPATLVRLMSSLKGNFRVVTKGDSLPAFDLHCPTMSLPLAFKTTSESIPADLPYLQADADKVDFWRRRLGDRTSPRIGLAWSGTVRREIDTSPARKRSIPLHVLAPLLALPIEFHSLQKQFQPDELAALTGVPQIHLHHDELKDFSDTAALVMAMDLVISIDTSIAHLGAALGQAIWILLPFAPDYRWTVEGSSTPWYPGARLFRQTAMGDWSGVISQVIARLHSTRLSG